jgi:hypothetical protein
MNTGEDTQRRHCNILVDNEEELDGKVLPLLDLNPLVHHYDSKSSSWNS